MARRCEWEDHSRPSSPVHTYRERMPVIIWTLTPLQSTQIAFVFAAEAEANDFYKKVAHRSKYASEPGIPLPIRHSLRLAVKVKEDKKEAKESTPIKKGKKAKGKIDKSMISGPVRLSLPRDERLADVVSGRRELQTRCAYGLRL